MKKVVVVVLGLAAAAGGVAWYWPRQGGPEVLRLPGTVEVQEVRLGSKVGGRVVAVHARESQTVEPGTVLVTFDNAELTARRDQARHKLEAAKAALARALAGNRDEEVAEARAMQEAAEARLAKAKAGYREEEKSQARHELGAALAELKKAEDEFNRVKQIQRVASSQLDYQTALAARDRAESRVKAAEAALAMRLQGSRPEDIAEAEAERDRYAARYRLLRAGARDEDKAAARAAADEAAAQLAEAEANLREAAVTAPERCVVEVVPVRAGSLVPAGQPVVLAHRADDLWVKVFVPSTELGKLRLGQSVEVAVDSHPGRRFPGQVTHIATVSEFTPRNVQSADERKHQVFAVKVRVTDPDGVFKSGMAAEVFVPLGEPGA
jgi:multidrug efflux pump subunit AcrA (membrane-fusion protein)